MSPVQAVNHVSDTGSRVLSNLVEEQTDIASEIILVSFSVFVVIFLGVGAFAAQRSVLTDVDYLLGSRSFGCWFIGLSAGATGNSGFIMLGSVGMGYAMGLSGVIMGLSWFLGDLTFWSLFPEKFNRIARDRVIKLTGDRCGARFL